MMDLINDLKMSAVAFRQMKAADSGEMMACVTVRGTFHVYSDQPLIWADTQDPIQFEDEYLGDPHKTPLVRCSDIIPFKPKADLTLLAWAVRPRSVIATDWCAGLKVEEREYIFHVHGRRYWEYKRDELNKEYRGWSLSEMENFSHVALTWTLAYGGKKPMERNMGTPDVVRQNPIGCGYIDLDHTPKDQRLLAPSLLRPNNPLAAAGSYYEPYGCAPISPWWKWRQQYAGTYDEAWVNEVHPRLPADFDYAFYQYAPPEMIQDGYFKGGENFSLVNIHSFSERIKFQLPTYFPVARIKRKTSEVIDIPLNLDGCHIDLTTGDEPAKVFLTWRVWVPFEPVVSSIRLGLNGLETKIKDSMAIEGLTPLAGMPKWK